MVRQSDLLALVAQQNRILEQQERLLALLAEKPKLEEKPKPKDWWDKTPVLVAIVTGVATLLIAGLGIHFSNLYRDSETAARAAAQQAQRTQVLGQFMPYLTSENPVQQRLAVRGIYHMGDLSLIQTAFSNLEGAPLQAVEELKYLAGTTHHVKDRKPLMDTYMKALRLEPVSASVTPGESTKQPPGAPAP